MIYFIIFGSVLQACPYHFISFCYSFLFFPLQVQHWLNELCEELSERLQSDMDQNKRIAHTLTLHARAYKVAIL